MIIRSAAIKNLHGHLDAKLSFKPGVNILIGVNGSGKTSILNAIAWTLSPASVQGGLPAAYLLSRLTFDEISIAFTLPGIRKYQRVGATRSKEAVTIKVQGIEEELEIPVHAEPASSRFRRMPAIEEAADLVARFIEDQRHNPVLGFLNNLPGPVYLPLDRRWTGERERFSRLLHRRSTTAGHLPISEVVYLAERAFRLEQHETSRLTQTLRNDFLTSLFEVSEEFSPRVWTAGELGIRRARVEKALIHLGLSDVNLLADGYFSSLEEVVDQVGGRTMPDDWQEDPQSGIWADWIINASSLAFRIEGLIPLIEKYDSERLMISRRTAAFLESVNGFLRENGKSLSFSNDLELAVNLPNGQQISSEDLASGELQLLFLFTFLYFQFDEPEQEFTVLVDEPELSLHVAWQNHYVNSITAANPNAQFIIATHSPEIAAGQPEDAIIDVSPELPV